ncbi:hypothetical protein DFH11DRAFT_426005 [Phellopilus nigrolimitatus]|nr:hypothetical protein DFH11DRAFT_426005 [Phellopilus nigrolimitatus]
MTTFAARTLALTIWLGSLLLLCQAYIPAQATNDTAAVQAGVNQSDTSMLKLQWFPNASFTQTVSYQLVGADTTGINKGALVHFSELNVSDTFTTTPWIAFVSCDFNTTGFSLEDDIFTLARDRGAVSALLYSEWSDACLINPEYADPATFDQVFDIFSTKSLVTARTVENSFTNVNQTLYGAFNASMLNQTFNAINTSIQTGQVQSANYLFATLTAANATTPDNGGSNGSGSANPGSTGSSNTDLAMIVLYVITGAVSVLFCVVILSGAIRAIRHPERYGPRTADPTMGDYGQSQSRARGITRAILDTFPVMKFRRSPGDFVGPGFRDFDAAPKPSDVESRTRSEVALEMGQIPAKEETEGDKVTANAEDSETSAAEKKPAPILLPNIPGSAFNDEGSSSPGAGSSRPLVVQTTANPVDHSLPASAVTPTARSPDANGPSVEYSSVLPEAIGRETCPICIVDFEEGDDIRVLPCEGKHVFHQQCVDPWLLELSSSCPICRHDFHALEEMIAGSTDSHGADDEGHEHRGSSHVGSRFSRYLRFARGRRGQHSHRPWGNRDSITEDPTDPPYPIVRDMSL